MDENIVEINGKRINLEKLSDEQLIKLKEKIEAKEKKYRALIAQYEKQYPFLKELDLEV